MTNSLRDIRIECVSNRTDGGKLNRAFNLLPFQCLNVCVFQTKNCKKKMPLIVRTILYTRASKSHQLTNKL